MKNFRLLLSLLMVSGVGCGASHSVGDQTPPIAPKPGEEITFEMVQREVIDRGQCLDCHSGSRPRAGVNLESKENILSQEGLVIPGNPNGSLMFQMVESGRMPKRGPKLPQVSIDILHDWILSGAP